MASVRGHDGIVFLGDRRRHVGRKDVGEGAPDQRLGLVAERMGDGRLAIR